MSQEKPKVMDVKTVFEKKWLGINEISWVNNDKEMPKYYAVFRPTTKSHSFGIDGVEIIPVIKYKEKTAELVMIANFRPPTGKFSLQFPAGLVESSDFEENALRELREQTGYISKQIVKMPSPLMHCDPWKSNEGGLLYMGIIDGDDPNSKSKQELDQSENIKVYKFAIDQNLAQNVYDFMVKNDFVIHSKTWAFCLGFSLSQYIDLKFLI